MSPSSCVSNNVCWKLPPFYRNLSLCSRCLPYCTFREVLAMTTYLSVNILWSLSLVIFEFVDNSFLPENISLVTLVTPFSEYPSSCLHGLVVSYYSFVFWCTSEIGPWNFPISLCSLWASSAKPKTEIKGSSVHLLFCITSVSDKFKPT